MSRDHPPLCDVTADRENAVSIALCWTVFTELLPGNALIISVTTFKPKYVSDDNYYLENPKY
jgi:hypothetical protein